MWCVDCGSMNVVVKSINVMFSSTYSHFGLLFRKQMLSRIRSLLHRKVVQKFEVWASRRLLNIYKLLNKSCESWVLIITQVEMYDIMDFILLVGSSLCGFGFCNGKSCLQWCSGQSNTIETSVNQSALWCLQLPYTAFTTICSVKVVFWSFIVVVKSF
jgi:hypothetical protein